MGRITVEKGKFLYPIFSAEPKAVIDHLRFNLKGIIWTYNSRAKNFSGQKLKFGRMYVRGKQAIIELPPGIRVNLLTKVLEGFVNWFETQRVDVRLPFWE